MIDRSTLALLDHPVSRFLTKTRSRVENLPFQRVRIFGGTSFSFDVPIGFMISVRFHFHRERRPFSRVVLNGRPFRIVRTGPPTERGVPVFPCVRLCRLGYAFHSRFRRRPRTFVVSSLVFRSGRGFRWIDENSSASGIPFGRSIRGSRFFIRVRPLGFRLRFLARNRRLHPCLRVFRFRVPGLPPCQIRKLPLGRERPRSLGVFIFPSVFPKSFRGIFSVRPFFFRIPFGRHGRCQMENLPFLRPPFPFRFGDPLRIFNLRRVFLPFFGVFRLGNIPFFPCGIGPFFRKLPRAAEIADFPGFFFVFHSPYR